MAALEGSTTEPSTTNPVHAGEGASNSKFKQGDFVRLIHVTDERFLRDEVKRPVVYDIDARHDRGAHNTFRNRGGNDGKIVGNSSLTADRKAGFTKPGGHDEYITRLNYAKIVRDNGDETYDIEHVGWFHGEQEQGVPGSSLARKDPWFAHASFASRTPKKLLQFVRERVEEMGGIFTGGHIADAVTWKATWAGKLQDADRVFIFVSKEYYEYFSAPLKFEHDCIYGGLKTGKLPPEGMKAVPADESILEKLDRSLEGGTCTLRKVNRHAKVKI